LTRDSFGSQKLSKGLKGSGKITPTPSRYTHEGKEIGNFQVIFGGRCILPPQPKLTLLTFLVTLIPTVFQMAFNNRNFVEN